MVESSRRVLSFTAVMAVTLFVLVGCTGLGGTGVVERTPVKSANDDYQYRLLTLPNEMEVLLISDPDTPKSAAALSVEVGSGDNPPGRQGLAHFLEHMLFLGTDKYPDAAEYEQYITEHGGNRNAYTSFAETNYFFDVNSAFLPEALDRFAQFFIAPRFDAQYVDREKNAIQAEYQMGLKSDGRRGLDVIQHVMNQAHPYSQFSVGSLETLADRPDSSIRDELVAFYNKHYSANAMRLVILGAQSLDELEALAAPMFSAVPNHSRERSIVKAPFFNADELPMLVRVEPLATRRQLEVFFPLPDYRDNYRENPLTYLGNLLGHEGEGSLLSQLKAEGLAEGVSAGSALGWNGGSLFSVNVSLTEQGSTEYRRVLQLLFAYAQMLRDEGPKQRLYDEQSSLSSLAFRYREPGKPISYVSRLASGMHHYDPVDVLQGPYLMAGYDASMLAGLVEYIRPDNAAVFIDDPKVSDAKVSSYYAVNYQPRLMAMNEIASLDPSDAGRAALHLPAANDFIAEDLSLASLAKDRPAIPQIAYRDARQSIWFMQDDEFRVPKSLVYINFATPHIRETAQQTAAASLYAALLMDKVNEFAYPARLAGLGFGFSRTATGIGLRLSGYNDKQLLLLERLLSDVKTPAFAQNRFENVRADMVRNLKNSISKRPSTQLMDDLREAFAHGEWDEQAMIRALESLDLDSLQAYVDRFWRDATAQALMYGNYEETSVATLSALLASVLPEGEAPAPAEQRAIKLAAGDDHQYAVDIPHDDAVVAWYLQGEGKSWKDRAATALTAQIMTSGFFQQLRTEQQLGYVVSAFPWSKLQVPGLIMLVQSPVADAASIVDSMRAFMNQVEPTLDARQFARHQQALISDITKPDKNLAERGQFYWRSIGFKRYDFAGREELAAAVEALTLDQWKAYFERVFMANRHSLQVVSPGKFGTLPEVSGKRYRSADQLRADHEDYRL